MNQYLGVKSGKSQMRNKAQCFKIMINYLHKLPHEEVGESFISSPGAFLEDML